MNERRAGRILRVSHADSLGVPLYWDLLPWSQVVREGMEMQAKYTKTGNLAMTSAAFATSLGVLEGIWCVVHGWQIGLSPVALFVVLAAFFAAALVAMVIMLALGRIALLGLRKLDLERPWEICATAALLGTAPLLAIWAINPSKEFPTIQFLIFAVAGLIAGIVYVERSYVVRYGSRRL